MNQFGEGLQKLLLKRSVFDILCDIWFIPNITLYIKAFVSPILYDMQPRDAYLMIKNDLPSKKVSDAILRKGLINLFPLRLKEIIMNNYAGQIEDRIMIEGIDEIRIEGRHQFGRGEERFMLKNQAAAPASSSYWEEIQKEEVDELEWEPETHSVWDNISVYHKRLKDEITNPKPEKPLLKIVKKLNMRTMAFKTIFGKIKNPNIALSSSVGLFMILLVFFVYQMKKNRKFRSYSKTYFTLILFLVTILGLGGSITLMVLKLKHRSKQRKLERMKQLQLIKPHKLEDE
jgi:hypothetical protein